MKFKAPGLYSAIFLSIGILIGKSFPINDLFLFISLIITILITLFLHYKHNAIAPFALGISLLIFGIWHYQGTQWIPPNHICHLTGLSDNVTLEGQLIEDPICKSGRTQIKLKTRSYIQTDTCYQVQGKILVFLYDSLTIPLEYGDPDSNNRRHESTR